jgi:hypothetical protein
MLARQSHAISGDRGTQQLAALLGPRVYKEHDTKDARRSTECGKTILLWV